MVASPKKEDGHVSAASLARMHGLHFDHSIAQREAMCRHRLRIINEWGIKAGDNVIELGCGHGEMTLALSSRVGDNGHVSGIDNAPPSYGAPLTLGAAQQALKRSKLGHRFDFHLNATIETFLSERRQSPRKQFQYNVAAFCHSLWYFKSRDELRDVFQTLWAKAPDDLRLCIAEWGLATSSLEGLPHVHAVLTQQQLEFYKMSSLNNMRTLMSPASLKELAFQAGWEVQEEGFFETDPDVEDGRLEVGIVLSARWWNEVEKRCKALEETHPDLLHHIRQSWEALDMATDTVGFSQVRCQDTFWAVFKKRDVQGGELEAPARRRLKVAAEEPLVDRATTNAPSRKPTTRRFSKMSRLPSTATESSPNHSRSASRAVKTPEKDGTLAGRHQPTRQAAILDDGAGVRTGWKGKTGQTPKAAKQLVQLGPPVDPESDDGQAIAAELTASSAASTPNATGRRRSLRSAKPSEPSTSTRIRRSKRKVVPSRAALEGEAGSDFSGTEDSPGPSSTTKRPRRSASAERSPL